MSRCNQAANDPLRDPDDDPAIRFASRWLMPIALTSVVLVVAVLIYVQNP